MPADDSAKIIPALRYRDAAAAVDWLCRAFGFERHLVVEGEDGGVQHAQLSFGPGKSGMVMLGPGQAGPYDKLLRDPKEIGGVTQGPYIIVDDVDAHHDRARAAGAEILLPPEDQDYGGRLYTCRDPEGHVWNFGSYDPWAER
jgi:uncharacterized glyoxalase superfamily protein PhnB